MTKEIKKVGNPAFIPKYSQKLTEFIVDKIEGGMSLAEVCKKFGPENGGVVPTEKNCYRWKKKYPEFKQAIDEAYQTFIFKLMDEGDGLTKEVMEISTALKNSADEYEAKFEATKLRGRLDAAKMRMKYIEFTLTRIAPKLVPELKEAPKQTVAFNIPEIKIINYAPETKGLTYDAE